MKVLPRTEFGNPILRAKAKAVPLKSLETPELKNLIREMIFTMRKTGGVGLAAPQIGRSLRLAVMGMHPTKYRPYLEKRDLIVIVNPRIIEYSKSTKNDWEGCLSFAPKYIGAVIPRPSSITVEYHTEKGEKVVEKASGLWARIFQHEIDHLNGIGYMDRIKDPKMFMTVNEFRKRNLKK
ncbi:MAG: peptide deformylase [Patescibacteria group bacterium]